MLYIFHVDTGTLITFDIKLALQSVSELKEAIERECGVVVAHQVLLMSGGDSLESNARVCSYSAGTDTNPIYLFSMAAIESQVPPIPSLDYGSDVDLQSQVDSSLAMPATYQTLVARAQLAQQCCGLARDQTYICERLVHDQHLQQQGWAAVVANLEDITQTFHSRAEVLQQNFAIYLSERQQHMELLQNFNVDLRTLEKIPILPALRAQAEGLMSPDDQQPPGTGITDSMSTQETSKVTDALSLLKWISAKDNQSSLEQVADQCSRGLEQFDERVMEALKNEVSCAIEAANKQEMKEIRGLGERLFSLQQLMAQMKKLVHDQTELAQGFHQNKTRVSNLNDDSVLPDLCTSHREQLLVMLQNHNQLRDIRRRCTKAKEELSVSIHRRLKWIMYVENKMMELDGKLVMYHESLRRLRRQLEILRQIHLAPQMYISAIVEVVRRRAFSQAFLVWASNLACQLLTIHNEETKRRREFQNKFEGHFLNTLFPGLEDTPPPFATQAPSVFDSGLPKLTTEDIEALRQQLPDLSLSVSTPDLNSITQFFFSKSLSDSSSDGNKEKENTSMRVDTPPKEQENPPLISDRKDFDSETEMEEFEKIRQASIDSNLIGYECTKQQQHYQQNRQKQLEENLGNTREEVERLQTVIHNIKSVATDSLLGLRRELKILKEQALVDRKNAVKLLEEIVEAVKLHTCALKEREQELTLDHEFELSDLKKLLKARDEQLRNLKRNLVEKEQAFNKQEKILITMRQKFEDKQQAMKKLQSVYSEFEARLEKLQFDKENIVKETNEAKLLEINALKASFQEKIRELEKKLSAAEMEHQKAIKEETEKLQLECKTQLETIRSRFKLMAASTMERSPSDSSLEKIERVDMIELINHETILEQAKKDLEIEKEEAIRLAIEHERTSFTQDLKIANEIINKNERELDHYRQREAVLLEECRHYKSTMLRLNEAESVIRKLEVEKTTLDHKISAEHEKLEQRENLLRLLEVERDELRHELNDKRLQMSQSNIELGETLKTLESDKDEVRVSESKKVRLEADSSVVSFPGRLEILESDNKRLNSELRVSRENKERMESKVEALENERVRLEVELVVKERSKRNFAAESLSVPSLASTSDNSHDKDMNASVSVVSEVSPTGRVDAATSTERNRRETSSSTHSMRDKLTKSASNLMQQSKITFMTCNPGDVVLILWDQAHRNYTVLQDTSTFYFLNSDCITDLDLKPGSDGLPTKLHTVAEVIEKEYCSARKPENRYRVPQGTRFYRVRVKPLKRHEASPKD